MTEIYNFGWTITLRQETQSRSHPTGSGIRIGMTKTVIYWPAIKKKYILGK